MFLSKSPPPTPRNTSKSERQEHMDGIVAYWLIQTSKGVGVNSSPSVHWLIYMVPGFFEMTTNKTHMEFQG